MQRLDLFENDLIEFIRNHPYTKKVSDGEVHVERIPKRDKTNIVLSTVNGEYEQLVISIIGIP